MAEQVFNVKGFSAAQCSREIGIVVGSPQSDRCGCDRRNDNRSLPRRNLPQSGGAFFLQFGVRGKILEWKDVARRQRDHAVRIARRGQFAKSLQDWDKLFDGPIVVHHHQQRPVGHSSPEHQQQGFGSGIESGNTNAPRALPQVGGNTRKGGKHFYVREEFANEGKKHAEQF